jgi:N-acylneuraminate cytidylyltransferase
LADFPSVLALIPARGGSKRLPGKNMRSLGGKPLVEWSFAAARQARLVGRIVLSSDDRELLDCALASPGIEAIERPAALASDTASSVDVALHALHYEAAAGRHWDVLALLQPTSPLRPPGRIDEGLALLAGVGAAAVVGVTSAPAHPFHVYFEGPGGVLWPAAGTVEQRAARSQELPRAHVLTGSFYAIRTAVLRRERRFIVEGTMPLACNVPGEAIDIDIAADFAAVEAVLASEQSTWVRP